MTRLLDELKSKDNRSAQFKTVIALQFQGKRITFEGICRGEITQNKIGSGGFGYDPIFKPTDYKQTFAELSIAEKSRIGHRGKAVAKLVTYLNSH